MSEPAAAPVPTAPTAPATPSTESRLYFCYGSNMLRSKFSTRGPPSTPPIAFTAVFKARLRDWQLCFDLRGAPPQEPAMASIQPKHGDDVHGLVYRLASTRCWEKLLLSEGVTETHGPYDSYHVVPVTVESLVDGKYEQMHVMTLVTNPRFRLQMRLQPVVRPSQRYMDILIEGATKEQLPEEYVERLVNTSVARKWESSILFFMMTLAIPLAFLSRKRSTRMFTYPLSDMGMRLYAFHEGMVQHPDGWSLSRGLGVMLCKIALHVLYSIYAIPAAVVVACSPRSRRALSMVMKSRFGPKSEKQDAAKQM